MNSYTTADQNLPSVAADANGDFVVVWNGDGQDGDRSGIFGQRFDSAGVAQGDEFQINSFTTSYQWFPSVASDAAGNFVVAWHGYSQHGNEIVGQRYDSVGIALGAEFQINSFTTGYQASAHVGVSGNNQFVVSWDSDGQDGSDLGVFGQRFIFASVRVEGPNTDLKWRIGSLEKIQWTHNLGEQATFRIELDRDDDGVYEELIVDNAPVDNATKSSFVWTVTGPRSGTARVRVAWTDDLSVSDSSDVTFQIRPVGLD